ncbi:MAG TPA: sigma-70 family RNA polymerase sigma factor [Spirochaetia bacterium]|nr:sigma-70 family RNA polymerase sigma factor [Spirochaetia bacterium]
MIDMSDQKVIDNHATQLQLEEAYKKERPRLLARLRAAGRTLEEAEDLVHDVYTETLTRLPLLSGIRNLPAWINSLFKRRLIDAWRHDRIREASGETDVAEETLRQIISGAGLNPLDGYVRDCLMDALNDALRALPEAQRRVVEAQVFGGLTFRELAETTGESIDTLTARKRYALRNLSRALRHWIEE